VLLWFFKRVSAVIALFGSKLGFIYVTTAVRAIDFNGVTRFKFAAVH
jgi:hypothetical protein